MKPALFHALTALIAKHPILSTIPWATETTKPYFVRLPTLDLDHVVSFFEDDANEEWRDFVDKVLEKEHNTPFESRAGTSLLPFWRLSVINHRNILDTFTLIFVFHHSLMDTQSAHSFHQELEEYMHRYSGQDLPVNTVICPSTTLLPPLEGMCNLSISDSFHLSQSTYHEPSPESWTGAPQSTPVKTRFGSIWLTEKDTRVLRNSSIRNKCSVTATLQALLAHSIFAALPSQYTILQGDCAVSLRRFLPQPIEATSLGCYVGSLSVVYHRKPTFDWDDAFHTKKAIRETLAMEGRDMPVGYLGTISDMHSWMREKLTKKRAAAFELSNIGTGLNAKPGGDGSHFRIESMLFSQSSSACSAAIKISAITGPDGNIALGFSWQEEIVDDVMIQKVQKVLQYAIESLKD